MNRQLTRLTLITLIGVSLILTFWLVQSRAVSQQRERIIERKPWPVEPVKVVKAKTKNKGEIRIDSPFDDEDDWLDGLTLTVENNYDKTVTVMTIDLVFPREPGDLRPPFAWELHFGPSAFSPQYVQRDPNKVIKVGQSRDFTITPKNYETLKRGFDQAGYPYSIKRVELVIREVGFEDGSVLSNGALFLQDPAYPNDPTKKITVPRPVVGAANRQLRSPPDRKARMTNVSFLEASFTPPPNPIRAVKLSFVSQIPTAGLGTLIGGIFVRANSMGVVTVGIFWPLLR